MACTVCPGPPAYLSVMTALLALFSASSAVAADAPAQREHLAGVIRQLELADRLAAQAAHVTPDGPTRYHFDFQRLDTDLKAVRVGIADYLTPQRAQPRDPLRLNGDYAREGSEPPTGARNP
ncbi:hypothetical protein HLH48_20680 [Gluconacetobacter sacchari]|uniref:RAQPRD family integrative conjugative element protein n=2 Tax=Gluconacetobacter sacchari TaxID=92759 RepID=A0A7W4NQI1_9PROT|nr:hypothetical protein [Gluconacetobacter sacchari]